MIICTRICSFMLILMLILVTMSGCWDRRELEERVSTVGVSIDLAEKKTENEEKMYLVSVQIPIPVRIAGGAGGGGTGADETVKVMSTTGFTIAQAFSNLQKRLNQQLFMGHTNIIAISDKVARQGIKEIMDGFRRDPAMRRLLWFVIVEGKAVELLKANPKLEQIPTVYITSLIANGAKTGNMPDITLGKFYISLSNPGLQPIANYVRALKNDVGWIGVALFDKSKMVGTLTSRETWALLQLRNEHTGGDRIIYPEEGDRTKRMVVRPKQVDTSAKVTIKDGKVKVHYDVYVQANVVEKNFDTDLSKPKNVRKLAKATAEDLQKEAEKLIKSLQEKHKVDALKLGLKIKAFHHKEWQKLDWEKDFPKTDISVSYKVKFRRTGMQLK